MRRIAAALLSVLLLPCRCVFAQEGSATLTGFIQDPSKAVIPGVKVTAVDKSTNQRFETATSKDGSYTIVSLPVGPYQVQIEKPGFKTILKDDLFLHTQDVLQVNFQMAIGSTSETITVTGGETNNSPAVSLTVNRDFVENMPLNGRSFQDLISLAPGATPSSDDSGLYSINGQRDDANYFTVDGVAANTGSVFNWYGSSYANANGLAGVIPAQTALGTTQSLASVDALQEFKIQTSGFAAEYGRQPGGQIELTTRSGSDEMHGSLFDYFRNEDLDANGWYLNDQSPKLPRPAERQNDFGGTIGGPLRIPALYDGRGKTFYFFSYEGLRLKQPEFNGGLNVPTAEFRNFAAPAGRPFLDSLPLPNVAGHLQNGDECAASADPNYPNDPNNPNYDFSCTGQWAGAVSNPSSLDSISVRLDKSLGHKDHAFLRYSNTPSSQSATSVFQTVTNSLNSQSWTAGNTLELRSSLVDEFRANYSQTSGSTETAPAAIDGSSPYPRSLVFPTTFSPVGVPASDSVGYYIPNADRFPIPAYSATVQQQHQINLTDNLAWIRGSHAFKFGVDYRRLAPLFNPAEYTSYFNILSVQSVQQGTVDQVFVFASQRAHPLFNNVSLFAQDTWRVSPRLSLTYGVRWEFNPPPGASDGLLPLALTSGNISDTQIAPIGTSQYHAVYTDFAPRVGFAYRLGGQRNESTVVRGGFGIFFDTGQAEGAAGYSGYPFTVFNFLTGVQLPATTALDPPPFGGPLTPPYGLQGVNDPYLATPYTEAWNLSIDQGLGSRNTLTLSYVGNNGRKLLFTGEFLPSSGLSPLFSSLFYTDNEGQSSYHSLQVQDRGYVAQGVQLIASYTLAHAIDNVSVDSSLFGAYGPIRGNSDSDIRQVLNAALNCQLPGTHANAFGRFLSTGWSVANRFSAESGFPLDVLQGTYTATNGVNEYIRPNLKKNVPVYLHNVPGALGGWELNYDAFSPVPTDPNTGAPLAEGSLGRNYLHSGNFWSLNTALQRSFPTVERLNLDFRVEAFNILNHPNSGYVDTYLPSGPGVFGVGESGSFGGGVGVVGAPNALYNTGAARSLELSLRLHF